MNCINYFKVAVLDSDGLEFRHLFEKGRTVQYLDLPDRLWATTGMCIPNLETFQAFGKLRNAIQHFAPPIDRDCSRETIEFIFKVIDPFINDCWGLYAVDYNEDHEPYVYFVESLISRGIYFLISPGVIENLEHTNLDWPKNNPVYQTEIERRFEVVRQAKQKED